MSNAAVQVEGSLLHFLDRAATPAGRRKVRQFIANPLFRCCALCVSCPCGCTIRCAAAAGRQLAFLQAYAAAWPLRLRHGAVPCRVGDIQERLATTELLMAHPQAAHNFQSGLHRAPGEQKHWSCEVPAHAKLCRLQ